MTAVFKREFRTFFTSPIGYFVMAVMFAYAGYNFFLHNLVYGYTSLTGVYSGLFTIVLLVVLPILTMRLLSDEKRQKTDQALLTAPTGLTGIVVGKFLAALMMFALSLSITVVFAVIIAFKVTPDWMVILGNFLGLLMMGGTVITVGMLISSLTESQFIAALGTFAATFGLMQIDSLAGLFANNEFMVSAVQFLSLNQRYNQFTIGVIAYDDVIFFLSTQVLFLFLTVRVLDRKRWN